MSKKHRMFSHRPNSKDNTKVWLNQHNRLKKGHFVRISMKRGLKIATKTGITTIITNITTTIIIMLNTKWASILSINTNANSIIIKDMNSIINDQDQGRIPVVHPQANKSRKYKPIPTPKNMMKKSRIIIKINYLVFSNKSKSTKIKENKSYPSWKIDSQSLMLLFS